MSIPDVVISYGRDDGAAFTEQLAADLQAAGFQVWFDTLSLLPGESWSLRIQSAINGATFLLAVLTPKAVREESVCHDEQAYAISQGKVVVPLLKDPATRIPLLLVRRNWIDFSKDYHKGRQLLLEFLRHGDPERLLPPALSRWLDFHAYDYFDREIARHVWHFRGREFLMQLIERWLADFSGDRAWFLLGHPGEGKTAIVAWLVHHFRASVGGFHFCMAQHPDTLQPNMFACTVASQLYHRIPDYAHILDDLQQRGISPVSTDPQMTFDRLVLQPLDRLSERSISPTLLIIDSLDEAMTQPSPNIVDLLEGQLNRLPGWIRLLMTSRWHQDVLSRFDERQVPRLVLKGEMRCALTQLDLDKTQEAIRIYRTCDLGGLQREDVVAYVEHRLADPTLAGHLDRHRLAPAEVLAAIRAHSEGNFLHAQQMLDQVAASMNPSADLAQLPVGLRGLYRHLLDRRFGAAAENPKYLGLFSVLLAAREPLEFDVLADVLAMDPARLNRLLIDLSQFLGHSGKGYCLFHKSFADWLVDREAAGVYWCDPVAGHRQFAARANEWMAAVARASGASAVALPSTHSYAKRHVLTHLVAAEEGAQLERALSDLRYMADREMRQAGVRALLHLDTQEREGRWWCGMASPCSELLNRLWSVSDESPRQLLIDFADQCELCGRWDRAAEILERVLYSAAAADEGDRAAKVHLKLAQIESTRGNPREALLHAKRGHECLAASLEWSVDPQGLAERMRAKNTLGRALLDMGNINHRYHHWQRDALKVFSENLRLAEVRPEMDDVDVVRGLARALSNLGVIRRLRGQTDKAWQLQSQTLELRTRHGLARDLAWSCRDLGWLDWDQGRPTVAKERFDRALEFATEAGDPQAQWWALRDLLQWHARFDGRNADAWRHRAYRAWAGLNGGAVFYDLAGYFPRESGGAISLTELTAVARRWYQQAIDWFDQCTEPWSRWGLANALRGQAWAHAYLGSQNLPRAAEFLAREAIIRGEVHDVVGVTQALWACVQVAHQAMDLQNLAQARTIYQSVVDLIDDGAAVLSRSVAAVLAGAHAGLGNVGVGNGDYFTALRHFRRARTYRRQFDPARLPSTLMRLGTVFESLGRHTCGERYFRRAISAAVAFQHAEAEAAAIRHLANQLLHDDRAQARLLIERAIQAAGRSPYPREAILATCVLGHIRFLDGDLTGARDAYFKANTSAQKSDNTWGESEALLSLALLEASTENSGDLLDAERYAKEAPSGSGQRLAERRELVLTYLEARRTGQDIHAAYERLRVREFSWLPPLS